MEQRENTLEAYGLTTEVTALPDDMAVQEFERWTEKWDIDIDFSGLDEEKENGLIGIRTKLTKMFQSGKLVLQEDALLMRLKVPVGDFSLLAFRIPSAGAFLNMDKHKERAQQHKVAEFMAGCTRVPAAIIRRLDSRDYKLGLDIVALFLH